MPATRGSIQHLGRLRGSGTLACGDETMGHATFEIDGYRTRTGEVVGSGEIRMTPAELDHAFGRSGLTLTTDDGRVLDVRFSGKRHDSSEAAAHADIRGALPPAKYWRR
jgi:hypothetical protein